MKEYKMKGWVGRGKNGYLWLFNKKPFKECDAYWEIDNSSDYYDLVTQLPKSWFPHVKWSDAAPTKVELIIREAK